jgi:uncharacterized protein (TIGR03663 family)
MHHDEVSGHHTFANDLYALHKYHYDPVYHGPLLYHFMALSYYLFGINDISIRLASALFGIAILFLVWPLRHWVGNAGMLLTASLIAVSPVNVYFSRFAIHDPAFAFFTLATVVSILYYLRAPSWKTAFVVGISLGFVFTVKESSFIFVAILAAYGAIELFFFNSAQGILNKFKHGLQALYSNEKQIGIAILGFLIPFTIFYSSFFRFPGEIIKGAILPISKWVELATTWSGHFKPAAFYFHLLFTYEFASIALGLIGFGVCVYNFKKAPYYRFMIVWIVLNTAAYFILKYKMSWLTMHLMLPFAVAAGFGLQAVWNDKWKYAIIGVCVILLSLSVYGAVQQSFYDYDDPSNKEFAYVQTNRDVIRMIDDVARYNVKEHVSVIHPEYTWAVFWYLNRKSIPNGHMKDIPANITDKVVLSKWDNLNLTNYDKREYNLGHHGKYYGYFKK